MKPLLELPLPDETPLLLELLVPPLELELETPLEPDELVNPEDPPEDPEDAVAPPLDVAAVTQVPLAWHSPEGHSAPLRHSGVPPTQPEIRPSEQSSPSAFVAVHKTAR
jgi:hypothetical protein